MCLDVHTQKIKHDKICTNEFKCLKVIDLAHKGIKSLLAVRKRGVSKSFLASASSIASADDVQVNGFIAQDSKELILLKIVSIL